METPSADPTKPLPTESTDCPTQTPKPTSGPTKIIFILGPPGAGKGTLSKHHPVQYGYTHLSVGDYLRHLADENAGATDEQRGGLSREEIVQALTQSAHIAAEPLVEILRYKLQEDCTSGKDKFLIDGFPRTLESAKLFDDEIVKPCLVINVSCQESTAKARFLARAREEADNAEKFDVRYEKFQKMNAAILEWYGPLVKELGTDCGEVQSHEAMLELLKGVE